MKNLVLALSLAVNATVAAAAVFAVGAVCGALAEENSNKQKDATISI